MAHIAINSTKDSFQITYSTVGTKKKEMTHLKGNNFTTNQESSI
jgi:hypothetical protein